MINWPKPLTGDNSNQTVWINKILDCCQKLEIQPSPQFKKSETPNGTKLEINFPESGGGKQECMNFPDTGRAYPDIYPGLKGTVTTWVSGRLYRKNDVVHVFEPFSPPYPEFLSGDSAINIHTYFIWTGPDSSSTPAPGVAAVNLYSQGDVTKGQIDPANWWVILSQIPEYLPGAQNQIPADNYPTTRLRPFTGIFDLPSGDQVFFVNGVMFDVNNVL